jgi:hypothetical protein
MKKTNWNTYKFRPSSLGRLMTNGRSKSEPLGETTKAYLKEIFIEEMYGRKKDISNKFTEKGILTEEDSLDLVTKHYGKLFIKNKEKLANKFITGTPDIILPKKVIDIKSSWDIWTFANADGGNKDYYWQLQGYMWLTGTDVADLIYCLNNSPEHLIFDEQRHQMYRLGLVDQEGTEAFIAMENEVEHNMKFDDIPAEQRIKVFGFDYNPEDIERIKERVIISREYLSTLSL